MARRQNIPTPLRQRWRQFRYRILPLISFAVAVAVAIQLWHQESSGGDIVGEAMPQEAMLNAGTDGTLVTVTENEFVHNGDVVATMDDKPLKSERAILVAQEKEVSAQISALEDEIKQENNRLKWEKFDRMWNVRVENARARGDAMRLLEGIRDIEGSIVRSALQRRDVDKQERDLVRELDAIQSKIDQDFAEGKKLKNQVEPLRAGNAAGRFVDKVELAKLERELAVVTARYFANLRAKDTIASEKPNDDPNKPLSLLRQLKRERETIDKNIAQQQAILKKLITEVDQADLSAKLKKELKESPFVSAENLADLNFDPLDLDVRKRPLQAKLDTLTEMEKKIAVKLDLLKIRAPFEGKVTMIHHQPGEAVTAGTPVVTIAATKSEFIVTYVRQTQHYRPVPNDVVEIHTRTTPIQIVKAKVQTVGAQVEQVPPKQLRDPKFQEWGLPVRIVMPAKLEALLRPGELVDIRFPRKPQADAVSANAIAPGALVGSVMLSGDH